MIFNCHLILENNRLDPCDYKTAILTIGQEKKSIWIDVKGADNQGMKQILKDLNVQGLIRKFCLDSQNHPGYYPLKPYSLLVMPVIPNEKDYRKLEYLCILFGSGILLTYYEKDFDRFDNEIKSEDFASLIPESSISGIISAQLFGLSMVLLKRISFIGTRILALEEIVKTRPKEISMEGIADLQSDILLLESVVQGQLPVFIAFATSDKNSGTADKIKEFQTLSSANLQSADRTLELLERRLNAIRTFYDGLSREKTNRRLERLTIMSTIFMPITFLAGIWGMNFQNMPLVNIPFGHLYAIIIMILISASMYFYFKNKGWFT
jgi:magnesium transporter